MSDCRADAPPDPIREWLFEGKPFPAENVDELRDWTAALVSALNLAIVACHSAHNAAVQECNSVALMQNEAQTDWRAGYCYGRGAALSAAVSVLGELGNALLRRSGRWQIDQSDDPERTIASPSDEGTP